MTTIVLGGKVVTIMVSALKQEENLDNPILDLRLIIRNKRLYEMRSSRGWSRDVLAELSGVKITRLVAAEQAKITLAREEREELASALNVEVDYIFPPELLGAISDEVLSHRHITLTQPNLVSLPRKQPLLLGESDIDSSDLKQLLEDCINSLSPIEQRVIRLRFGLEDGISKSLEDVGKEFNLTRERIRQIEAKGLRHLRHPSKSRKLKDYLETGQNGNLERLEQESIAHRHHEQFERIVKRHKAKMLAIAAKERRLKHKVSLPNEASTTPTKETPILDIDAEHSRFWDLFHAIIGKLK